MSFGNRSFYNTPSFAPFQSGCSKCYPSTDYSKVGGNKSLISTKPGKNLFKDPNFNVPMKKLVKDNLGISFNTSAGGSKKKSNRSYMKGGESGIINKLMKGLSNNEFGLPQGVGTQLAADSVMGEEMMGSKAASMNGLPKNAKFPYNPEFGVPQGPGTQMAADSAMMGGKKAMKSKKTSKKVAKKPAKKSSKKMKGGESEPMPLKGAMDGLPKDAKFPYNAEFGVPQGPGTQMAADSAMMGGKKAMKSKKSTKKVAKKPVKKSSKKTGKKMKGGQETWGATGMPARYYDPNTPLMNYPSKSGDGAMSAYGKIVASDVGTGNLAPFTVSKSKTANPATMMKTGGNIPPMNTSSVKNIRKGVDSGFESLKTFFSKLQANYNKTIDAAENIKIGKQRLIQGGKKKEMKKKDTKKKDTKKKVMKKKVKKGGDGSDWSLTANSRGPSNAPDNYFGVDGEKWFRQFNKTGQYIPNSQLATAATPKLVSGPKVEKVMGYTTFDSVYAPVKGGAMKKKVAKKSKKTDKKKTKK